jgi:hypothetical protein
MPALACWGGRRWLNQRAKHRNSIPNPAGDTALRLRREAILSVAWIAKRLGLSSRQYVTKLLYRAPRQIGFDEAVAAPWTSGDACVGFIYRGRDEAGELREARRRHLW